MAQQDYPEPTQGAVATDPAQPSGTDKPEVPAERAALVKKILDKIKKGEKKHEKRFKRMREDMKLTRKGASDDWADTNYTANLIQRHVKQRVSALYAKNPTVKARRRQTQDYMIWDGNIETAKAAMTMVGMAVAGQPVQPGFEQQIADAQALLQDIAQGRERQKLMDSVGKTLELCFKHYMDEGQPPFKLRAKQLIRRAVVCSVGYVKLGYQRIMGRTPDYNAKMSDVSGRLEHLQRLADEAAKGDTVFEGSAELEELRLSMQALQSEPEVILREGLIFDFPRSYDIIPIGDCVELKGFVGCEAVAQQMLFTPEKVKELYDKDIKDQFTAYNKTGKQHSLDSDEPQVRVFEYYDKASGLMYTLADGYCDFLEEPAPPPAQVEQFFPFFVVSFNDIEDEDDIFPPSDPELLRSQQMEYNRAREALRQHRIANQPNYAAPAGAFPDWSDEHKLMSAIPHEILKLNALATGQKVDDVLQPIKKVPIDPALYDTAFVFEDILRTVGSQEANLGGTSGSTATESSIAENSRMTAQNSEIDDVDDMLSQLARAGGQILLKELSAETARKIAGPGAKWPELSATEIAEELYLDVEAGSSGKPNKGMELANWERMLPLLIQVPGVSPTWTAKETIKRMDDRADLVEAMLDGAPSIMAMNAAEKAASSNPQDQGVHGGDNAERAPGQAGGPQANMGPEGAQVQGAQAQVGPDGQPVAGGGAPQQAGMPPPQPLPGAPPQAGPQLLDAQGQPMAPSQTAPVAPLEQSAAMIQKVTQDAVVAIQQASGQVAVQQQIAETLVGVANSNAAIIEGQAQMLAAQQALLSAVSKPRQVVRDSDGRISALVPVE